MNKRDMLESLINYYTDGNKAKFAAKLGINAQNISAWLARNTFDAEVIFSKCENVSASWLLSGLGNMINTDQQNIDAQSLIEDKTNKELVELCKQLVANYKQRDSIVAKLVDMI